MTLLVGCWNALVWRMKRPLVRRRLRRAIAGAPGRRMIAVQDIMCLAGLEGMPRRQFHAALTDLANDGAIEGDRGPGGWVCIRALPAWLDEYDAHNAPTHDDVAPSTPPARRGAPLVTRARDWRSALRLQRPTAARGGATATPAPAVSSRTFSVATRLHRRRGGLPVAGLLLFVVAIGSASGVARSILERGAVAEESATATRAGWYRAVAIEYVDAHRAGRTGFAWPYRFNQVAGIPENATRAAQIQGMEKYLQVALYTGSPAQAGIFAWARGEFGELPDGPASGTWMRRVAETYAARALAGTPGYELPAPLLSAGGIAAGEKDSATLAAGIERALRAALYLGTPELGGVLDWARRTIGELPARE